MKTNLSPFLRFATVAFAASSFMTVRLSAHPEDAKLKPKDDTCAAAAQPTVTGTGDQTFKTVPAWGNIPEKLLLGPTHGSVVVDKKGTIYVSSDSPNGFYVFSPDGTLLRTTGKDFSGVHGMMIREEDGVEYIYAAHLAKSQVVKLTLEGKAVLTIPYPKDAKAPGADVVAYPEGKGYKPTGVTVGPNGDIYVVDGYGASLVHRFDSKGNYLKTFGGKGKADGQFSTCHGIALDTRFEKPLLLICDRANNRLQHFDLEGNFVAVITKDLRLPCAVSIRGDFVAIAELQGRVTILDKTNKPVAFLGDNPDKAQWAKFDAPVAIWKDGIFCAPHGLSYDAEGNLYVQDWNKTGRVTKLVKSKG